jgi:microcin C transport system substrate-binding protein
VSVPPDISSATYRLRAEARWHDGKPVTPEDVLFSFGCLQEARSSQAAYYQHVTKAEKVGEREIKFTFDETG